MDFDGAIKKHAEWKLKLHNAMTNHESLNVATISSDNVCEMGKWLHGEAKLKYQNLPTYKQCLAEHAAFHTEAGKVAAAINAKKYAEAEGMLASGAPFSKASFAAAGSIFGLKMAASK